MSTAGPVCAEMLTPPGAGAIAVVRVGGIDADHIVDAFFRPASKLSLNETSVGSLRYGVFHFDGVTIDDIIACPVFRDDRASVVDLCMHGGVRVVERVLAALESRGVGVVSQRPVRKPESGSSGWNEAGLWPAGNAIEREVDRALERATTRRAVSFLATQRVELPRRLKELGVLAQRDWASAREALVELAAPFDAAHRLLTGATVVLAGPPNSGKSTLFNRLVGREAAVVSPIEGTTRDWVSAEIEWEGLPVTLVDTAGRHDAADGLEQRAMHLGARKSRAADVVVVVEDLSRRADGRARVPAFDSLSERSDWSDEAPKTVVVGNKLDLVADRLAASGGRLGPGDQGMPSCSVSAATGEGFEDLVAVINSALSTGVPRTNEPCLFTERQFAITSRTAAVPITDNRAVSVALGRLLGVE